MDSKWEKLNNDWAELNDMKYAFAYGEEHLDEEFFTDLVRDTFDAISDIKKLFCAPAVSAQIMAEDFNEYTLLVTALSEYAAEYIADEYTDCGFLASQFIVRLLLSNYIKVPMAGHSGILRGCCEDLKYYPLNDNDGFLAKTFIYDIKSGDMSDFLELAQRYQESNFGID